MTEVCHTVNRYAFHVHSRWFLVMYKFIEIALSQCLLFEWF